MCIEFVFYVSDYFYIGGSKRGLRLKKIVFIWMFLKNEFWEFVLFLIVFYLFLKDNIYKNWFILIEKKVERKDNGKVSVINR